jgi:hypothetical protein
VDKTPQGAHPRQKLVTETGKAWVLTQLDREGASRSRAIRGLILRPTESEGLRVTPLDLGVHNIRTYVTYDYAKSTNNNTGKITFSSRGTKFEVRALTLEDADWLFPGEEFLSLRQLNEATLAN